MSSNGAAAAGSTANTDGAATAGSTANTTATTTSDTRDKCAAGDDCKVHKHQDNFKFVHKCLNCDENVCGALCGVFWDERGADCTVNADLFSAEGKIRVKSHGTILCATCMKKCTPSKNDNNKKDDDDDEVVVIDDPKQTGKRTRTVQLQQAAPPSKKPRNRVLYTCFTIVPNAKNPANVDVSCNGHGCTDFIKTNIKSFNSTRGLRHALSCSGITEDVKASLRGSSQDAKKKVAIITLEASSQNMSEFRSSMDSVSSISRSTTPSSKQSSTNNKTRKQTQINSNKGGLGEGMNRARAEIILKGEVKTIVARREPLSRLLDDYARAALIQSHPGIGIFIPKTEEAIFDKFVMPLDEECVHELMTFIAKQPGLLCISMDGATVNGKQKIIYTLSKSDFSIFLDMSGLGTLVHVTDAEAADALRICEAAKIKYGSDIACIPVDNAARLVAQKVCDGLSEACLVSRDPAHCVDLFSKDLAGLDFMKPILAELKEVYDFVRTDRIDSIRIEAKRRQDIPDAPAAVNRVETRMNSVHDYAVGVRKQAQFITYLPTCDHFKQYLRERTNPQKAKIDGILVRCNHERWEKFDFLTETLTVYVKRFHKLCCMGNVPLSAYLLLCQAMRNAINKSLKDDPTKFDLMLGEGAKAEMINCWRTRFNMDGNDPSGAKVGLLNKWHIWAFICDPFNHKFRARFHIEGDFNLHVKDMINHFVPLDHGGADRTRQEVRNDFENFYTIAGSWLHAFDGPGVSGFTATELLKENTKKITFDDVQQWIEDNGGVAGRFRFFEARGKQSIFYQKVAKPLMSMRTVGSIDVERRIKPVKNDILSKQRNKLTNSKATILYRTSENLRHLMNAKKSLGKKMNEPLELS